MTWAADPVYGVRAVPIGQAPAIPARGAGPLIYTPGSSQDPGMNVIPFPAGGRNASCKLVNQGMDRNGRPVDPYADYLASIPDVQHVPGVNDHLFKELIPGPDQLAMIEKAKPLNERVHVSDDPGEDARPQGQIQSYRTPNLVGS